MKIKISKSQWQLIGKTAGWEAESSANNSDNVDPLKVENVVPVEQIIGTKAVGTADQIDREMHAKGYFLFREHYRWGRNLSYQNKKGDKVYLEKGVWMTWPQLKEIIKDEWRPASREDQDWFIKNLS